MKGRRTRRFEREGESRRLLSVSKLTAAALLIALPSFDLGTLIERPVPPFGLTEELVVVTRNGGVFGFVPQ